MYRQSRRHFLRGMSALGVSSAALAVLAGCSSGQVAPFFSRTVSDPPETTRIRLIKTPAICFAPQYMANDLLRAEGFTDVQYVDVAPPDITPAVARGEVDMAMQTAGLSIVQADANDAVVMLAGVHVGCFELFGNTTARSVRDLKGKRVAVTARDSGRHVHLAIMAAYVGIDPNRDIQWIFDGPADAIRQFKAGQVDALMAFPPEPQQLRATTSGHVIVSTSVDRPWSQYYCCVLHANRTFVQQNPIATKRALRAILKATDLCAREPERAARYLVDGGYTTDEAAALQTFKEVPYDRWREYDPEDTVRFYSLRLQEIGMIRSSPAKILAQGTDWRFLNELKQELKA